jgi:hypothetical protein
MFTVLGHGKLAVNAIYPTQFLFERAYGNYLGLCRLGLFVSQELKLELAQVTCYVGIAVRADSGVAKSRLTGLATALRATLQNLDVDLQATAIGGDHAHAK